MGILDGKVAVVTGGTSGLGLAIVRAFAREGAAVVVCGRSQGPLERAAQEIEQRGQRISGIVADVGNLADVRRVAAHAVQTFGRIDIWVNNAGVSGVYGPAATLDPAIIERGVRTNILGVYYGSVVAIRQFQAQGSGGKLINMLGSGDRRPASMQSAYAPTKAWVRSFTTALAKEYAGAGFGIYMFNPGLMDTAMMRQVSAVRGFEEKLKPLSTVMRLWSNPPTAPAEKVVWLASSATDGKTGLEKTMLTTGRLAGGVLREVGRRLLRRPAPDFSLDIRTVEPYNVLATAPTGAEEH